ncbi:unnamed protein product [Callosobruchus maculatus]|uniref:6-phosphofructo-2-kinase domain-containing protein n=1 Tax=Callosobruchus maculatus TaxID=64391 RepID=A0A653BG64_CALMS|nr:unnamed protein product [Callosobruchus maculatus]
MSVIEMDAKTSEVADTEDCKGAMAVRRQPLRQFGPLLVAMVGLPGRGKSMLARRLSRYLNYTGDKTKAHQAVRFSRDVPCRQSARLARPPTVLQGSAGGSSRLDAPTRKQSGHLGRAERQQVPETGDLRPGVLSAWIQGDVHRMRLRRSGHAREKFQGDSSIQR